MSKTILLILIGNRKDAAVKVQQVLTGWGCIIKTRLGIHDGILENCSDAGLLMLELYGTPEQKEELTPKSVRVTYSMRKQAKLNRIGAGFSS